VGLNQTTASPLLLVGVREEREGWKKSEMNLVNEIEHHQLNTQSFVCIRH